ncbi:MAG: glycosyltransferase [Deltaproteobacteria bacterium]|nr:glycosyltransferase [Deltaproteobacteria bacterium]
MIRVSYIAVTRNRAKFIERALENWRALKRPGDELVVVDGASTDGTYEILARHEGSLIDTLIHEADRGEAHAFNKGFLTARGELIKLLTDDDVFYGEALELAYRAMAEHPEIDVLNTGGENVAVAEDGTTRPNGFQFAPQCAPPPLPRDVPNPYWRLQCGLGLVIRRRSLALTGLFDVRHRWVDTSFLLQAMQAGANVKFIQVKGFRHEWHPGSASAVHRDKSRRELATMLRERSAPLTYRLFGVYDPLWYLAHPSKGASRVLRALSARVAPPPPSTEPEWNGEIY